MGQMGMGQAQGYGLMGLTPSDPYFRGLGAPETDIKKAKNLTVISAIIGSDSLFGVRYGSYGYWVGPGVLPDGSDPI